jgi:formamidopyrimidine-DNA glycosylase
MPQFQLVSDFQPTGDQPEARDALVKGIQDGLLPSIKKGGAFYELNLHGKKGGFRKRDILIGYRQGEPCPKCGTKIAKIRTGGTSSFVCPVCQPLQRRRARQR